IKVLPDTVASDPERLARFEREAQVLASLNQPNIAAIYSLETAVTDASASSAADRGETPAAKIDFLVMELVEGEDLARRISRGPLATEEALTYALQIARALEAAQQQGVVHRDLKPANIVATPKGTVKVLDFGLAKVFRAEGPGQIEAGEAPTAAAGLTTTGSVLGTAAYMSPEQIRGEPVDERTDLWAFGCVLYEMLTGRGPFGRQSDPDSLVAILREEPDWVTLPADLPPRIETLLRRCLRKDADRRLHHAADARIEVEEALQALHSQEPSPGSDQRDKGKRKPEPAPTPTRSGLWVLALLATVLLAAAITGWIVLGRSDTPEITDRSIAVLPFETLGEARATAFTDGIHGDMLTRLSQVSDLRVVSRTSVMRFRESERSLPEIARELGVTWVLGADIQEVGNQVQVNARLMNAARDQQVWAESYRRELTAENLFQIQGEITERVVVALQAQLSPQEKRAVERAPTADLDAYRLYVQGRALLEQRTADAMWRAVGYFQRAIDRDAKYALAWAGLGDALVLMNWYGYPVPETGFGPMEAVRRALETNPELGEAHATLGLLHAYRLEGPPAVRALERAVELRPSYVQAQGWLCFVYLLVGQPEAALEVADRTATLQPPPETRAEMAEAYLANGDPRQALEEARRARQLQPEYKLAQFLEGLALYDLGRFAEAEPVLRTAEVAFITPGHLATLAIAEAATGDTAPARELLGEIGGDDGAAFWEGLVRAGLGETDEAFEAFDRVDRWGDWPTLPLRYYYPDVLGPLRNDRRYRSLLETVDQSWGLNPDGTLPLESPETGRVDMNHPESPADDRDVDVTTTKIGPDAYEIAATATLDSPPPEIWALLQDWERFLAVGLAGLTDDFEWLTGGPGQVPSTFRFTIAETLIKEEIYERSVDEAAGSYRLRYRTLEPALGILEYDALFRLEAIGGAKTAFSAVREVRLEPGSGPEQLAGIIADETRRLREHFAANR
ncbi:MAG: protein kinase, partial [Acidobacteriota bacterium]